MISLVDRILRISELLEDADIPYAFGGALALAYCTGEPRATRDIDINIFMNIDHVEKVQKAVLPIVEFSPSQLRYLQIEHQTRVFWDDVPIDLFFDVSYFHREMSMNTTFGQLKDRYIPILSAEYLAILKILFDRTKDWADIEAMVDERSFDHHVVLGWLFELLGQDDGRIDRLDRLVKRTE